MIKRISMPKSWPLARKGKQKYVVDPRGSRGKSIALVVALRDLLGIMKTSYETKKTLHAGEVMVNNDIVKDKAFPVYPLDIICLPKLKKYFKLVFKGRKFAVEEVKDTEAKDKAYKVIGKKVLKKGKIQINLFQGVNILASAKDAAAIKVNDSVLVDLQNKKMVKPLPLKEKAEVLVIGGKHMGESGRISKIDAEKDLIFIDIKKGEIRSPREKILVIG